MVGAGLFCTHYILTSAISRYLHLFSKGSYCCFFGYAYGRVGHFITYPYLGSLTAKSMPVFQFGRIFLFATFSLFLIGCSEEAPSRKRSGRISCVCIGITDGDTITILSRKKKNYKVRLAHVDCPERNQPFNKRAKDFTSNFCYKKKLQLKYDGKKDRNGRLIAVVFDEQDKELNAALVEAGLAWHYKKYSDDMRYDALEQTARKLGIGLWSESNPVAPWEWRAKH